MLDFFRGMGMLLVILQHSRVPYSDWILVFHMPLMFFLSGYTNFRRDKNYRFGNYLLNRVRRLLIPYLCFEIANLLLWQIAMVVVKKEWQDLTDAFVSIATVISTDSYMGFYGRLWFLPCMFVSDILFESLKRIAHGKKSVLLLEAALMLAYSWFTSHILPERLPFTIDTACMATVFLLMGYAMGEQISKILESDNTTRDIVGVAVALLIMYLCISSGRAWCHMHNNRYGNYLLSVVTALSGCVSFLIITKWLYRIANRINTGKQLILWLSHHSLETYACHMLIKSIFLFCWSGYDYSTWYLLFGIMLIVNIPLSNLIFIYFPFMLGMIGHPARSIRYRE